MTRSKDPASEVAARPDTEIEKVVRRQLTPEQLANIQSYDDIFGDEFGEYLDSSDLGDGFAMGDKANLVGKEFAIVDWEYGKNNDFGNPFVIVRLVTKDPFQKLIITDGSTGIMRQLELIHQLSKGKIKRVKCRNGLRASEYWVDDVTGQPVGDDYAGKKKKATTYYIDQV